MDALQPDHRRIPTDACSATPTRRDRTSCSLRPGAAGRPPARRPRPRGGPLPGTLRAGRPRRGHRRRPVPRGEPGEPAPLADPVRGRRPRRAVRPPRGPTASLPARLGRAGRDRRAAAHVLEQQAPRGRVHAARDLPARPPRRRPAAGRPRHGPPVGPAREGSRLRAWPTQRALAHRHQGPVLPAPLGPRVREDLDRRARRRPQPLPDRAADPAPAPGRSRSSPGSTTASSCAARRSSS